MTGDVVNLRRARKERVRAADKAKAAENRNRFGRTRVEKDEAAARETAEARRHDGHRLRDADDPASGPD